MKIKIFLVLLASVVMVAVALPSRAALVYLPSEVLDTSTNLLWLDASLSVGMDVTNSYTDSGWRHATFSEVHNLFTSQSGSSITALMQQLGGYSCDDGPYTRYCVSGWMSADPSPWYDTYLLEYYSQYDYRYEITSLGEYYSVYDYSPGGTPLLGHFLVQTAPSTVPLPGALILFLSGLGAFSFIHIFRNQTLLGRC